jgi:uncharacterized protein YidB (DUF937 family)
MGLFDQLAGQVLGSLARGNGQTGGQSALLQLVLSLVQNSEGGLGGLLAKLNQGGLGEQVASWVGTGKNLPVSAEQISQVLGGAGLGDIAAQLGLSREAAAGQLADLLPQVIDGLTPNGQVPEAGSDFLTQGLSALGGMLGKA